MNREEPKKKQIPESRIAWFAVAILIGAVILYALNMLLPKEEADPLNPEKTPAATAITDESGQPAPIDCYLPDIAGSSVLLLSSDGKSALIDAGYPEDAPAVIELLRRHRIDQLDLVFLTCADDYAIGGMAEVLGTVPADALYLSTHLADDASVSTLIATLEGTGTDIHAVHADFVSTVGWAANAELRILSPYNAEYTENEDNTLVLRLKYGDSGVTFLGNAGALAERMIVKALPNRLLHTNVILLTDTGRKEAPYEKFFQVSDADYYVLKSFRTDTGAASSLERFLSGTELMPLNPAHGLHLVLDGAEVQVVK